MVNIKLETFGIQIILPTYLYRIFELKATSVLMGHQREPIQELAAINPKALTRLA